MIQAATEIAETFHSTGFMNIQFFKTVDGYKLTDINPRFAGSQVNSLVAGVNFPEIFLTYEVLGETMDIEPDWDTQMFRYRVPVFYSSEDVQHPGAQSLQLNEAD